jgi:hypothetical protein
MATEPIAMFGWQRRLLPLQLCTIAVWACSSQPRFPPELLERMPTHALLHSGHLGPEVIAGENGPARFAKPRWAEFDAERAMQTVRFVDGFYREPGNDGFEASLDHVKAALSAAGYGATPELLLEEIITELREPAWTPVSASLELFSGDEVHVLHSFDSPAGKDRTMLPVGAPSGEARGVPCLDLKQVKPGAVLVFDNARECSPQRAAELGASALLVASLNDYNVDPSGAERHLDAIQYRSIRAGATIPVLQISRRSLARIQSALRADPACTLRIKAEVKRDQRPLRTLVATVVGRERPEECVVTVAHVQEPGAVDNASGVGGICEVACSLAQLLEQKPKPGIERPSRSVVFLFGDEMRQSRIWLEHKQRTTVAAISADMIGASLERTGAKALLERGPDPGAVRPLPPDEHTAWGSARVTFEQLKPSGVNVILRTAVADVGALSKGWVTNEHPYEGGSDHDVFLAAGLPAALLWHFTDFAYHTSLDRMEHVDPQELKRMSVAVCAATLALADPQPIDLDRYLRTNLAEKKLRQRAAEEAKDAELKAAWETWSEDVRQWLRRECLQLKPSELPKKKD